MSQHARHLAFGGDYNPEQWPAEVQDEDLELMAEAGVTLVTLGVFSWGTYEPERGRLELDWLDATLDRLHGAGIAVDLATPTAAPPVWLLQEHPEILPVSRTGQRYAQGGRLGWCASHPVWRAEAERIVGALAERYGDHPAVTMWHLGNELGGGNRHCYCDVSAAHFQRWLAERYGDVDALNAAWGTAFWGHRYTRFEHVLPPRDSETIGRGNPGLVLDFDRFSSDALLEHLRAEAAVVRAHSDRPVTTNFMVGTGPHVVDYARWAAEPGLLQVTSTDHYVHATDEHRAQGVAWISDRMRGLRPDEPWLLMETAAGAVSWQPRNVPLTPGELRRNAFSHVARGADGVLFFQWRASAAGAEQFHSGMVPHAGRRSRTFAEVVELGADLRAAAPLAGTLVERARVAVLVDDEAGWAWEAGPKPIWGYPITELARQAHRVLHARGIRVDVVPTTRLADLELYDLVVVPGVFLMSTGTASAVAAVADRGARVVVGHLSGLVDPTNRVVTGGYPGLLRELLGVHVDEQHPLLDGVTVAVEGGLRARDWTERVEADDASVVARYLEGPYAERPAVTRRDVGATGQAWYVSAAFDDDALGTVLDLAADGLGLGPVVPVSPGLDVVRRGAPQGSYLVVLNPTDRAGEVHAAGTDLLTGVTAPSHTVPAGAVVVIAEELGRAPLAATRRT